MRQLLFLFSFLASFASGNGQEPDSSKRQAPVSWKKMELAPRFAFGIQKGFYLEAGAVLQQYFYDSRRGFAANAFYISVELIPGKGNEKAVIGVKAGAESVYNGGTGGIEVMYLTNGAESDVVITPKLGFGIGLATLFYGYNFSTNKYPFDRIRQHQFSLAINTNLLFYHSKYEKKE